MISPWQQETAVALQAARAAAEVLREVYARGFTVDYKGHDNPVTEADRRGNTVIEAILRGAFPADGLCAEESDPARSAAEAVRGGRCWMVDPLDGTREFVNRNGEFCVMVGLAVDGVATLGVVLAPVWQRTLVGVVGHGAWEILSDGTEHPLRVTVPLGALRLAVSRSHPSETVKRAAIALGVTAMRPCGSVGLKACLVATGEADLYLHAGAGPSLWDGCAPEAIARAAGATVTDAHGRPLRYATDNLALDQGLIVGAPAVAARAVGAMASQVKP